jgi:hypothetical protein
MPLSRNRFPLSGNVLKSGYGAAVSAVPISNPLYSPPAVTGGDLHGGLFMLLGLIDMWPL